MLRKAGTAPPPAHRLLRGGRQPRGLPTAGALPTSFTIEPPHTPSATHAGFRPDIEGLRAVSIGLVLLFHAFGAALPGGFIGVDVFFVISGFLITNSLLDQHAPGQSLAANLARFWARRVRRLLPNALLVLVVVSLVAAWTLNDVALARLGAEVGWSAVDAVNWLFLRRSVDYLRWGENDASVLLNYWSLAVEEQFYLVWPLVLLGLLRWGGRRTAAPRLALGAALVLGGASFVHMLWLGESSLTAAFFASTARAWELMVGAGLALLLRAGHRLPAPWAHPVAWAGMLAIVLAAGGVSAATAHPGWSTLLPVLGAAAVIGGLHTRPAAPLTRLLGAAPMRAVGARSYSIYLWHWPVLALGALWWPGHGAAVEAGLLAASLLLAEAAWRWVETPARRTWALRRPSARVLAAGLAASVAVFATGVLLITGAETGLRSALLPGAPRGVAGLPSLREVRADLPVVYRNGCHADFAAVAPAEDCRVGPADAPADTPVVLLFGDSHAAQWLPALQVAAAERGMSVVSWTKSACPSADVTVWIPAMRGPYEACDRWRESVLARVERLRPALVVVSNFVDDAAELVDRSGGGRLTGPPAAATFDAGLQNTLERLRAAGVPVVLMRDNPRPRRGALGCLYASADPSACARPRAEALPPDARDLRAARAAGVPAWDLGPAICADVRCPVVVPGSLPGAVQVVYRDDDHLTAGFVATLAPALASVWAARPPTAAPR
jgi:peptidoglycan/LPS O-acetylase OafA/YrhL